MDTIPYSQHELWAMIKRHCRQCMQRNQGYKYCTDTMCEFGRAMRTPTQITLFDGARKELWLQEAMEFIGASMNGNPFTIDDVRREMEKRDLGGAGDSSWWTKPLTARMKRAGYRTCGTTTSKSRRRNGAVVCLWKLPTANV